MSGKYLRFFPFAADEAGKACLLIALLPFSVNGASPWRETSGNRTEVTSGYSAHDPGDYPLYVSGAGSELVADASLSFHSEASSAALVEQQGTLTLNGAQLQTNMASTPAIKVQSGYLNLNNSSINTTQPSSYGIDAHGDAVVNIIHSDITLAGTNGYGVQLRDNTTLVADGLQVSVGGTAVSAGVILNGDNSSAHITNSLFNLEGGAVSYGIQQNLGDLVADNITVIAKGMSGGVRIGDWGPLTHTTLSNSHIQVEDEYALLVRNSSSQFNNLTVISTGDYIRALDINMNAEVVANGGSYTTFGEGADAVWLPDETTRLTLNNAALITFGSEAKALNNLSGAASLSHSQLATSGAYSAGIYTQSQVTGDALTIATRGDYSRGVFSAFGGQLTLTNSTIDTVGASAYGIIALGEGSVTASGVTVTTRGADASALFTQSGSLTLADSAFTSAGAAPALLARGDLTDRLSQVSLDNATLTSVAQEAIRAEAARLKLTASNGAVLQGGDQRLLTALTAVDSASGARFASHVEIEAQNQTRLNGDVEVDADSYASLTLRDSSQLTGAVHNADLALYSDSRWQITGSSALQDLVNEGVVAFQRGGVNDELVVAGNYVGNNGTLIFNTALGADSAATNRLIVKGDTAGSSWVEVVNAGGTGAKTIDGIELIAVQGASDGEFVQKGRIVAGAWEYQLKRGADARASNWYLVNWRAQEETPAPTPEPQPEAPVMPTRSVMRPEAGGYIANSAAAATLFNLSLHDRLGNRSLKDTENPPSTSLWLRQTGGHSQAYAANTLAAQSHRYTVQLGGDLAQLALENGRLHLGAMAGYGRQATNIHSTQTHYAADSAISGYSLGAYATWLAAPQNDSGPWLDSWLQYNWFDSSVTGEGLETERYHTQGISASLEAGYIWKALERQGSNQRRYGFYLQPHAQLILNGLKTVRLVEHNGTQVVANEASNLISRVGMRGWITESKQPGESDLKPYLELNWLYNSDPYQVKLNGVTAQQNSGQHLAEIKAGVEGKVSDHFQLQGSVALQQGRYHYQDASVMLNAKYLF